MRKTIDEMLAVRNRSLRTLPGKLLFGPTGKRLFVDYLDKRPGFTGRVDFIHKLNLPGIFRYLLNEQPVCLDTAEYVWYPSHLHALAETDAYGYAEDRFITWEDVAVSRLCWTNMSGQAMVLRAEVCEGLSAEYAPEAIHISRECVSHDISLIGVIVTDADELFTKGLVLQPGEKRTVTVSAAIGEREHDSFGSLRQLALRQLCPDAPERQREAYDRWFDDVPVFSCDDPLLEKTWWYRWFILRHCYAQPNLGSFHHGVFYEGRSHKVVKDAFAPWGHEFSQLIPMSSAMHILDCRWKRDGECCRETGLTLLDSMDGDGIFRTMAMDKFFFNFGNFNVWAIYQYYLLHRDTDYVRRLLPGLKKNVRGVRRVYKNDSDDLQICYNHRRSGKEYQPSFWYFRGFPGNARDETGYDYLKRVDMSCYLYVNARGVQKLCGIVGDPEGDEFGQLADSLKRQILSKMWDRETGFFYDLHHSTEEKAMVQSVVGIYPLWADITGDEQLSVLDRFFDSEAFAVGSTFASVSKSCPAYRPMGGWKGDFIKGRDGCMWNGPAWPYTTCIALEAIAEQSKKHQHAYDAQFGRFLREYSWEHYKEGKLAEPYLVEHYNAETGEPLSDEADYNHSYYIDLIVRQVAGIEPAENGFAVDPVDIGLNRFRLERVFVNGHAVTVEYCRNHYFRVYVDGQMIHSGDRMERMEYLYT